MTKKSHNLALLSPEERQAINDDIKDCLARYQEVKSAAIRIHAALAIHGRMHCERELGKLGTIEPSVRHEINLMMRAKK